jgi:hypothetical protein
VGGEEEDEEAILDQGMGRLDLMYSEADIVSKLPVISCQFVVRSQVSVRSEVLTNRRNLQLVKA